MKTIHQDYASKAYLQCQGHNPERSDSMTDAIVFLGIIVLSVAAVLSAVFA